MGTPKKHKVADVEDGPAKGYLLEVAKWLKHDIVCGLHSGFPPCCVLFFITKKRWMSLGETQTYFARIRRCEKRTGKFISYVPCPECLRTGRIVKLKRCPKSQGSTRKRRPKRA